VGIVANKEKMAHCPGSPGIWTMASLFLVGPRHQLQSPIFIELFENAGQRTGVRGNPEENSGWRTSRKSPYRTIPSFPAQDEIGAGDSNPVSVSRSSKLASRRRFTGEPDAILLRFLSSSRMPRVDATHRSHHSARAFLKTTHRD
jgi:hypothetical protein